MSDEPAELERAEGDELAESWLTAWTGEGAFERCCTGDVSYEDPLLALPITGIDAVEAHAVKLRGAFPDLSGVTTAPALLRGAHACFPWRMTGTHLGDIGFVPATEREVSVHGLHYVELVDGRVRRARGFVDVHQAALQLGLLPERGGFGEAAMLMLRGFGLRL